MASITPTTAPVAVATLPVIDSAIEFVFSVIACPTSITLRRACRPAFRAAPGLVAALRHFRRHLADLLRRGLGPGFDRALHLPRATCRRFPGRRLGLGDPLLPLPPLALAFGRALDLAGFDFLAAFFAIPLPFVKVDKYLTGSTSSRESDCAIRQILFAEGVFCGEKAAAPVRRKHARAKPGWEMSGFEASRG